MGTKERVGTVLKKAARILPGIGSYQDKESLRETDKRLRGHISAQLLSLMKTIERLKTDLSRKGSLSFVKDLDDLSRHMDRLSRMISFASRGYAGVFDSQQVDEKALSNLFEFDLSLKQDLGALEDLVGKISAKDADPGSGILDALRDGLFTLENRLNEREALLKG